MVSKEARDERSHIALAERMASIRPFFVMEIQRRAFELEAQGRRIIHMEIGQPDFGAPPSVMQAAMDALNNKPLGYTDALGIPALRAAIADFYLTRYGVSIPPERIIVTAGASGAFMIAVGTLFGNGAEVLMPDPCYPCNRHFVRMFDASDKTIPVDATSRYQLTLAHVQANWGPRSRGVMLASPANPTGTRVADEDLRGIIGWVRERGGLTIVDEIYQGLTYDGREQTALSLADDVFVINSFSKYFGMTGWRIGWIVAPQAYIGALERFAQNAFICVSTPAQHAALAALEPEALKVFEERRRELERRRDFMLPALRELGFGIPLVPEGAFYLYADCSPLAQDSRSFALDVLERAGVAITPGLDFGKNQPERYVRFAYTRSMDELSEGVERLGRLLKSA